MERDRRTIFALVGVGALLILLPVLCGVFYAWSLLAPRIGFGNTATPTMVSSPNAEELYIFSFTQTAWFSRSSSTPTISTPSPTTTVEVLSACVRVPNLKVRSGPGGGYTITGEIFAGDCFLVDGRSEDNTWIRIRPVSMGTGEGQGWVTLASLGIEGEPLRLPVQTAGPKAELYRTPTPAPTIDIGVGCPQGCTEPRPGCEIKGNISSDDGEKIYHLPGWEMYADIGIDPEQGERWFCTEEEAVANGWRPSRR